ncbi:MAG: glycosyltransferase [Bifidobacteriaceae bacterium]|nr:glycosyltransferase [Bifidobacteriaceae bacterium]
MTGAGAASDAKLTVVTPWYPSGAKPYAGGFVRDWCQAAGFDPGNVTVVHLEAVDPGDTRGPESRGAAEGTILWNPVPVSPLLARAAAARQYLAAVSPQARSAIQAADLVVAHVGLPAGWVAAQLVQPKQRFAVVEHASYLPALLAHREARALYLEAIARADAALTAGAEAAARIRQVAETQASKIWAVGNPLRVDQITFRDHSLGQPLIRWLYVGNLVASKGVFGLLKAFARASRDLPEATLELAGQGVDLEALKSRADGLGVAERVRFLGAVDVAGLGQAFDRADVLVHPSPGETFGLAPIEALAAGLPVVAVRNAGTSQTLPPAVAAGRARLVASARRLPAAIAGLGQAPQVDGAAAAVRQELVERFGPAAFEDLHRRLLAGLPPARGVDPAAGIRLPPRWLALPTWRAAAGRIRAKLTSR